MHRNHRSIPAIPATLPALLFLLGVQVGAQETVEFNRDIRPILANNCYQCHGPDVKQRKADLRLDEEEAAVAVIERGKPQDSELIRRVKASDQDERMPPAHSGKSLTARQIELLDKWVSQGAPWQQHWSLQPPSAQQPPEIPTALSSQAANDIDRFLLHRLQQHQLKFSQPADRRTLIRRVYFDLTGLPPRPEDVDAFVKDKDRLAFEKLVDQLLESPQYGERMALYWLDLVRYADTNGIHGDNHREHWLYRDYVIQAFNDNMPFDQFTREQLAGDLMKNPTRWQRIASGYNRLNMTTREGGAQAKEYQAKYAADRVRNASTVWMGATLGCAECHDHKFDPYTSKDFYQFAAFFADVQETPVGTQQATKLPTEEQRAKIAELDQTLSNLQKQLDNPGSDLTKQLAASLAEFEKEWYESQKDDFVPQKIAEATGTQGSKLQITEDVVRVTEAKDRDHFVLKFVGAFKDITGIRLETLSDETFPAKGPGLASNGNFVVSEVRIQADGGDSLRLKVATGSHSQKNFAASAAADGKSDTGWAILPQVGKSHVLVVPLETPVSASELTVTIECNYGSQHMPGKLRVSTTTMPDPGVGKKGVPDNIVKLLKIDAAQRTQPQQAELAKWHRTIAPELEPLRAEIAQAKKQKEQLEKAAPAILITTAVAPRTMRVLPRGNWLDESGEEVRPAAPGFLPPIVSDDGKQRLTRTELAEWMIDKRNPFVARVMVNRLWKIAFGHGIVRTLDDLGEQGRWPTHPALLDYLAVDFRDHGWNIKRTLRKIVLSNAYQQSSLQTKSLRELDPFNELYARQSRFRLDAELVRDNALFVSGLLVDKQGGPSAKPYQPAGYWSHLNFPRRTYQHDTNENQYRRGLYTYWCRTFLHPSLRAFDATTREECTVERPRSNTPLAALALLNDPTYVEAARVLAETAIKAGEAPGKRLQEIYRRVLSRQPSPQEAEYLLALVEKHREQYAQDEEAAKKLLSTGLKPRDATMDVKELAAWTSITRVVLNLHETITRN